MFNDLVIALFTWKHVCCYKIVSEELVSELIIHFEYGILCIFYVSIKAVDVNVVQSVIVKLNFKNMV